MNIDWELISNFMIALLAIVNPIEKIPLWVEATKGGEYKFRWLLAGLIMLSSAAILFVFLWFGRQLLFQLKIELASFKIGGGLILLQFGFSMMKGTAINVSPKKEMASADLKDRVLDRYQQVFIPIGVPVIAGPGAITTVIIYGYQSSSLLTSVCLSLSILFILGVLFVTLLTGPFIQRFTGELPLNLISRIFGLILIAISVQFMVEGLVAVFPGWT